MIYLEILGAIFSIAGALFISKATEEYLYKAFCSFYVSNLMLLAFFALNGKIPMVIQMVLFFASAIVGIVKLSKNKTRDKKIILYSLSSYIFILGNYILYVGVESISLSIELIDIIAVAMAIIGSFLLSSKSLEYRSFAYILFLLADILFVYIGYHNSFYFFMIQSSIYIYTSYVGFHNNNKQLLKVLA